MNTKILVDSIMRQTTVLIAQLTASAGVRAPMARLADEVFLNLSEQLESEGLSRKVVADMFGMALRGYQRRVQRLKESATEPGKTLWESVLAFVEKEGPVTRQQILDKFFHEDPNAVRSILQDLINSGLFLRQGSGAQTRFVALPEEARTVLARKGADDLVRTMVWLDLVHHPASTVAQVVERLGFSETSVMSAIETLRAEGHLTRDEDGIFSVDSIFIDASTEHGWETAVFHHFQALCAALISKLRHGGAQSSDNQVTGGSTVTFDLYEDHPEKGRVEKLLRETRERVNEVWAAVEAHNEERRIDPEELQQITFYFGQYMRETGDDAEVPS